MVKHSPSFLSVNLIKREYYRHGTLISQILPDLLFHVVLYEVWRELYVLVLVCYNEAVIPSCLCPIFFSIGGYVQFIMGNVNPFSHWTLKSLPHWKTMLNRSSCMSCILMMMKQETSCLELFLLPVMLNFNELNDVLFPFEKFPLLFGGTFCCFSHLSHNLFYNIVKWLW